MYASEENKTSLGSDASVEMEVEGTDSVGEMLASEIQTQKDERFQNEGNCIMSLKFEGEDKDDDQSSRNVPVFHNLTSEYDFHHTLQQLVVLLILPKMKHRQHFYWIGKIRQKNMFIMQETICV